MWRAKGTRGGCVACGLLAVVLLAGCKMDLRSDEEKRQELAQQQQGEQQRQQEAVGAALKLHEEQQAAALKLREKQEAEKQAQARSQLLAQPDQYLESSDFTYYDKGIINDYRQLVGVRVLNKSKYPVTDLQGEVDWIDTDGQKVGSVPFTLKGSIAAGATVSFSEQDHTLSNGTLQASAKRARLRFTSIRIAEAQ